MHDIESKIKPIEDLKEQIFSCCKAEFAKGTEGIDSKEMGEAIDMVKDLAETAKFCCEAEYFKSVIKAMEGGAEEEGPYGYNPNRNMMGQYSDGRAGRRGFRPTPTPYGDMRPWGPIGYDDGTMGYSSGGSGGNTGSGNGNSGSGGNNGGSSSGSSGYRMGYTMMMDPEAESMGKSFAQYRQARRHYTETKDPEEKKRMNAHANEHVMSTIATIREMWQDADPDLRKRMKSDFENLLKEMT